MAVHDAYARVTPYELLFPSPDFPDARFPAVEAEAAAAGIDLDNPAAFATLGGVHGILQALRPEGEPAPTAQPQEAAAATGAHADVLYFAYQIWRLGRGREEVGDAPGGGARDGGRAPESGGLDVRRHGRDGGPDTQGHGRDGGPDAQVHRRGREPDAHGRGRDRVPDDMPDCTLVLLTRRALRDLLASPPVAAGWEAALRGRAGYLQLPQRLAWAEAPIFSAPESVDGFFWAATQAGVFHAAAVAGMRRDRPGYGVVPVPPQQLASLSGWTDGPARDGGAEFATDLPGAEMDGLVGIRTPAEVMKLLALALHRLTQDGGAAGPPSARGSGDSAQPVPSRLPFFVL